MIYGILAGNKLHLSEIARSLNENITLKKTIDRLSRNLSAFKEKETVMKNYISEVKKQINEENAVIVIDNSDITKPCSPTMEAMSTTGVPGKSEKDILLWKLPCFHKTKKCHSPSTKRSFRRQKKELSVQHTRIYNA